MRHFRDGQLDLAITALLGIDCPIQGLTLTLDCTDEPKLEVRYNPCLRPGGNAAMDLFRKKAAAVMTNALEQLEQVTYEYRAELKGLRP
jgi:hypothetical protein